MGKLLTDLIGVNGKTSQTIVSSPTQAGDPVAAASADAATGAKSIVASSSSAVAEAKANASSSSTSIKETLNSSFKNVQQRANNTATIVKTKSKNWATTIQNKAKETASSISSSVQESAGKLTTVAEDKWDSVKSEKYSDLVSSYYSKEYSSAIKDALNKSKSGILSQDDQNIIQSTAMKNASQKAMKSLSAWAKNKSGGGLVLSKLDKVKKAAEALASDKKSAIMNINIAGVKDLLNIAKNTALDKLSTVLIMSQPVLLASLKSIKEMGGEVSYYSYYSLIEMLKKDYVDIVNWMIDSFNLPITAGTSGSILKSPFRYGGVECDLAIWNRMKDLQSVSWLKENRYNWVKSTIVYGKSHPLTDLTIPDKIITMMRENPASGYSNKKVRTRITANNYKDFTSPGWRVVDGNGNSIYQGKDLMALTQAGKILYAERYIQETHTYPMYPSAFGDTGCDEFGTRFKFTSAEINIMLPQKKDPTGTFYITTPKSIWHYKLLKNFTSAEIWGENRLQSKEILKRLNCSISIPGDISSTIVDIQGSLAKSLGIDKIVSSMQNRDALMYEYIKYLKKMKAL